MGRLYDVAIIGAGLAGSSMANVLAGMGWDSVLIDQHHFPRHKVCGEFLSPESQNILGALGLEPLVRTIQPSEVDRARLVLPNGTAMEIPLPGLALGVSRYALDSVLQLEVKKRGGDVRTGVTVASVSPCERGYRVETLHKQERVSLEARAVIGAWGRTPRSGLTAYSKRLSKKAYIGIKSHFEIDIESEPVVELYFFPGGYAGVLPLSKNRINVAALLSRETFHSAGKTVLEAIETIARLNPAFQRRLTYAKPVAGSQAAAAPVDTSRQLIAWDLIPHIGDAAAVIPPLCGDGMAMAFRSVQWCAPLADGYLRGKLSLMEWRHAYTQALRREFVGPVRWGGFLQFLLGNSFLLPMVFRVGSIMPGLAVRMVQATRLRGEDIRGGFE